MSNAPPPTGNPKSGKARGAAVSGHAFAVGETVRFYPTALQSPGFGGLYVVVRHLPVEAEGPQYQVRCLDGGQQRVVPQMQLRAL